MNLFTVPSSDVADTISSSVVGPTSSSTVDLAIAAQTLAVATNDSIPQNHSLAITRDGLRVHVAAATDHLAATQVRVLARTTPLSPATSVALVTSVHDTYPTVATRALATTNGTTSRVPARRVAARYDVDRALISARLRVAVDHARAESAGRVPEDSPRRTASLTLDVVRTGIETLVEYGAGNATDRLKQRALSTKMAQLPAGHSVLPVPGAWYVTVNVWLVDVRVAYDRVEARSAVASPSFGRDEFAYVREA